MKPERNIRIKKELKQLLFTKMEETVGGLDLGPQEAIRSFSLDMLRLRHLWDKMWDVKQRMELKILKYRREVRTGNISLGVIFTNFSIHGTRVVD